MADTRFPSHKPNGSAQSDIAFHLMPGKSLREEKARPGLPKAFAAILQQISPALRKELIELDEKVLAFVGESKQNAVAFATDPLAVVRKLGLSESAAAEVQAMRARTTMATPVLPGLHIRSITLDTKGGAK